MSQKLPKPLIVGMLTSLVTGLATLFLMKKFATGKDKPPKGAPQLDIKNPGSQDDFITSATESEVG